MTEQIAAVLERLSGQPDRFDELRTLLADTALREELLDYTDEVTRETSARFAAKELDRAGFYSQLLQREGRRLKGPDALDAVDEILRQYPQIINAIDMALSRNDAEQLAVFAEHIAHPLTVKSRFKEGEALFEQLLKKAEDLDDRALGISARLRYGQFLYYLSRFDEASTMLAQAAAGAEQEGDDDALARALDFRGHITRDQGSLTAALAHYKRSLEIYRRLGDRHGIRIALFNMSGLARMQFRYSEAKELLQEALEIARDECDEWTLSKIVGSFALIALAEGKLAEAKRGLESAIAIHEKIGDLDGVAKGLGNLANANDDLGNFTEAEQCYRRTIEIYQSLGKRFCVGLNLNNLAYMLGTIGRAHEARELFSSALAIARDLGDQEGITAALHGQAGLAFRAGDYLEALEPLDECIAISQEIGQTEFLGNHYASQSLVYYALGDYDRADACVDLALQTYDSIAKYSHIADALCDKTRICVKAGRLECAVGLLLKALANYQPTEERHFLSLPLAAGNIFIAAHRQADAAVMFYALQHHIRQKGIVLSLCDQTELEEGLSQVASLPPDVLARAKARGEALSPEELADHALKALRDLQQELDGESFEEVSADRPPEDKTEEAAKHDAGRDAHA